jgi:hypothetical protein
MPGLVLLKEVCSLNKSDHIKPSSLLFLPISFTVAAAKILLIARFGNIVERI